LVLSGCDDLQLNNPYSDSETEQTVLYSSFTERPKHLDPAISYSSNEYALIGQIYEPPFQYHYLKRPYILEPLTAEKMPAVSYFDAKGKQLSDKVDAKSIDFTEYLITLQQGIKFQPHPAFAKDELGSYLFHRLSQQQLDLIVSLADFKDTDTREVTAKDYIYQIKRLAHPKIHSPIAELMKQHIVGLTEFSKQIAKKKLLDIASIPISGVESVNRYQYRIRIKGKYPQFIYWLAMPFFAPMPWEADVFYSQQGLIDKNITLDWYPVGTGPYMLVENNPNRRMILEKNPEFHPAYYPAEGEEGDQEKGLLADAGKKLPFIDKVVYILEKETIPYWNKFLQGYYDASGIASDSFDQAVQFTGQGSEELTPQMLEKGIQLQTVVQTSTFYMGFNMLNPVVGGDSERARKLRQAIAIAMDYEEYIAIFMNGRGVSAQGAIPPGIYGYQTGQAGINPHVYEWVNGQIQRKSIETAKQLMIDAGYAKGIDTKTGEALILYFDTSASGPDDRARLNWYRKQFGKLGIQLVIRATDYNRFQQKMRSGNAQIFIWGWNADYPDPENFFFLLYGGHGKVKHGGENAANYQNTEFDRLFEQMRNMENSPERLKIIRKMEAIVRYDAPWLFGLHPKNFSLFHSWYQNLKPNLMANNRMKYTRIDTAKRSEQRKKWNQPVFWPIILIAIFLAVILVPAINSYRRKAKETMQ
jgi:ABC-type transport system substrate-binding protein